MSESLDLIKGIFEKAGVVFTHFDDPNNVKKLFTDCLGSVVTDICKDESIPYERRLMFIATAIDARKSKRLVDIVKNSIPLLNEDSDINKINEDWIADFFEKASTIHTEESQIIWSRILAEEINAPNSISKRFLHNLYLMSKKDADNFLNLSRFCFYDRYSELVHSFLFVKNNPNSYAKSGITTEILKELEQFSLIEINYENGFVYSGLLHLLYTNHYVDVRGSKIPAGNVRLTADGQRLFKIIEKKNNNQILEFTAQLWEDLGCEVKIMTK